MVSSFVGLLVHVLGVVLVAKSEARLLAAEVGPVVDVVVVEDTVVMLVAVVTVELVVPVLVVVAVAEVEVRVEEVDVVVVSRHTPSPRR